MANRNIKRNLFNLLILGLATTQTLWAAGRSADDYIHAGAGKYIQGRIQEASVEVDEGLRKYPNDAKLKALAGQLKAMKDQKKQDQGESGSQGEQDPNQKDNPKDSSGQGDSKNQDQKEKSDQQKAEEEKKKQAEQAQKEEEEKQGQAGKEDPENKDKGDSTGQAASPVKPGEMSKEEAERLLNSYQNDEKKEHEQMQRRQKGPINVEKDW